MEGEVEELRRGWRESRGGDGEGRSREQLEEVSVGFSIVSLDDD